jgi:cellulose synthase/poly-beta-1,6-N-acetylglucosamine synthase-like glycosyltransferase
MIALQIILYLLIFLIFHTYVGYPILLKILAKNKKLNFVEATPLPDVSIIIAVFNEEAVIEEKINSIISSDYPLDKIQIIIGSDNSTDNTNTIIQNLAKIYNFIDFTIFTQRMGKSNIVNNLINKSKSEILILTDANVFFDKNTIKEIIKPFSDPNVGLVDTNMKNTGLKKEGISIQEKAYISREVFIKHYEGLLWGTMMGPFGGCFAIRKNLYSPVPHNFFVDDFYICMKVIQSGKKTINNLDAKVFEDVSNNLSDEFRRKVRISTGNFQNLWKFRSMLLPLHKGYSFSFLSHKVLRWLTPIFIILSYIIIISLISYSKFYIILFIIFNGILLLPLIDFLLKILNIHNTFLRFITHFFSMNIALLIGMFRAMKGVKSNVWKPTKRNQ